MCWQRVTPDLLCQSPLLGQGPLLGPHLTFASCCCFYGEGWGMQCALCPSSDSGNHGKALVQLSVRKGSDPDAWSFLISVGRILLNEAELSRHDPLLRLPSCR